MDSIRSAGPLSGFKITFSLAMKMALTLSIFLFFPSKTQFPFRHNVPPILPVLTIIC